LEKEGKKVFYRREKKGDVLRTASAEGEEKKGKRVSTCGGRGVT